MTASEGSPDVALKKAQTPGKVTGCNRALHRTGCRLADMAHLEPEPICNRLQAPGWQQVLVHHLAQARAVGGP